MGQKKQKEPSTILIVLCICLVTGCIFGPSMILTNVKMFMEQGDFTAARKNMDALPVLEFLMPEESAYIDAYCLVEKGKHLEALQAFRCVEGITPPQELMEVLEEKVYLQAQEFYDSEDYADAEKYFSAVPETLQAQDYLTLIQARNGMDPEQAARTLAGLILFADAEVILTENQDYLKRFLVGRWEAEESDRYFEMIANDTGGFDTQYRLPMGEEGEFFYLIDGDYRVGSDMETAEPYWHFYVMDADQISLYSYITDEYILLYRQ